MLQQHFKNMKNDVLYFTREQYIVIRWWTWRS